MSPVAGMFLTSHAIYKVKQIMMDILAPGLPVITSQITIFLVPRTSSDGRKHSNSSSTSDNNKEEHEMLPKRSLKSTSSKAFGKVCFL